MTELKDATIDEIGNELIRRLCAEQEQEQGEQ